MFGRLLALFIVIPFIELAVLIDIGRAVGTLPTLLLVIGTGVLGAHLARNEGLRTIFTIRYKLDAGELPADELLDGLIILIAGILLITPGVITDCVGLLMLYRPTRARFKVWLKDKFSARIQAYTVYPPRGNGGLS